MQRRPGLRAGTILPALAGPFALHGQGQQLKYEFRVRPGARPADIRLAYTGAASLTLDSTGALLIDTEMGVLRDAPPVSYQMTGVLRQAAGMGSRLPLAVMSPRGRRLLCCFRPAPSSSGWFMMRSVLNNDARNESWKDWRNDTRRMPNKPPRLSPSFSMSRS